MLDGAVGGAFVVVACTAVTASLLALVLYAHELAARSVRVGRHLHLVPPPAPTPVGLPLERIVRNLRRLQPEARRPVPGTPYARRRAVAAAYDDLLLDACRAVEVPTSLAALPQRIERELERAGLPIRFAS